jgi:hypothetical protein
VGTLQALETKVTQAYAPNALELGDMRWELEPFGGGTRLTLWHSIDRRFISWGPRAGTSVSTCSITFSVEPPSAALLVVMR